MALMVAIGRLSAVIRRNSCRTRISCGVIPLISMCRDCNLPLALRAPVRRSRVRPLFARFDARSAFAAWLASALVDQESRPLARAALEHRPRLLHDLLQILVIEGADTLERIDSAFEENF